MGDMTFCRLTKKYKHFNNPEIGNEKKKEWNRKISAVSLNVQHIFIQTKFKPCLFLYSKVRKQGFSFTSHHKTSGCLDIPR